jgi:hypothetical protein
MFNNKYNPDIQNNFNNLQNSYYNTNYEFKNKGYNLIIEDSNILKDDKFEIEIDTKNNKKIIDKFQVIYNERNIKKINKNLTKEEINDIKKKFKLKNTELFNSENEIPDDFDDIKAGFVSDFKEEEEELKKGRSKFNNILDSLLEEGILD